MGVSQEGNAWPKISPAFRMDPLPWNGMEAIISESSQTCQLRLLPCILRLPIALDLRVGFDYARSSPCGSFTPLNPHTQADRAPDPSPTDNVGKHKPKPVLSLLCSPRSSLIGLLLDWWWSILQHRASFLVYISSWAASRAVFSSPFPALKPGTAGTKSLLLGIFTLINPVTVTHPLPCLSFFLIVPSIEAEVHP